MAKKTEKMEFPIQGAEVCPHCGSDKRIARGFIDELKAEKKLHPEAYPDGVMIAIPFTEVVLTMLAPVPEVPALQFCYDVCGVCSTMYCTKVNKVTLPVEYKRVPGGQMPPGPGGPFMGRG